jgi:hypothetical protein
LFGRRACGAAARRAPDSFLAQALAGEIVHPSRGEQFQPQAEARLARHHPFAPPALDRTDDLPRAFVERHRVGFIETADAGAPAAAVQAVAAHFGGTG